MNAQLKCFMFSLVFFLCAGCQYTIDYWYSNSIKASAADEKLVMDVYQHLYDRELRQVANLSVAGMNLEYLRLIEGRFIAWFPEDPIADMKTVGASQVIMKNSETKLSIALQVRHKKTFVLFEAILTGPEDLRKFESFQISKGVQRRDINNSVSWQDVTALHIVVLILMVIVPIFIIFTLYNCWQFMVGIRRSIWMFFIFWGLPKFILNWGSGDYDLLWLSFNIFGISFSGPDFYSPLRLEVALPLGACMYWMFKDQKNNDFNQSPPDLGQHKS